MQFVYLLMGYLRPGIFLIIFMISQTLYYGCILVHIGLPCVVLLRVNRRRKTSCKFLSLQMYLLSNSKHIPKILDKALWISSLFLFIGDIFLFQIFIKYISFLQALCSAICNFKSCFPHSSPSAPGY